MPLVGIRVDDVEYKFDEALELSEKGILPVPHPVVSAIVDVVRRRESVTSPRDVSVTDLTGCPRSKVLRVLEDYYLDIEGMMSAFRGAVVHDVLAKYASENATVEKRTSRSYKGYTLYGTPDSVVLRRSGRYHLVDFKTTRRVPAYGPYSNHVVQVNVYRWLLGLPTSETDMEIVYISMDDAKIVPKQLRNHHVWEDRDVEEYLDKKFVPLAQLVETDTVIPVSSVPDDVLSWACSYCPVKKQCITRAKREGEEVMAQIVSVIST